MSRPSRDDTGLKMALTLAERGTCARRKVGCILVDENFRIIGTGYNGPASGEPHCIETPCAGAGLASGTGLSTCEAIHAEANALIDCRNVRRIHTCYCTASPCRDCVKLLLGTTCHRVVFIEPYPHADAEALWHRSGRAWIKHVPPGAATTMSTPSRRLRIWDGDDARS